MKESKITIDKIYIQKISSYIAYTSINIAKDLKKALLNDPQLLKEIIKQVKKFKALEIGKACDDKELQRISLYATFLFYLKATIYISLQKGAKHLKLAPIKSSESKDTLQKKYKYAIGLGYDFIFSLELLNDFLLNAKHLPLLLQNAFEIGNLNLNKIGTDIFGNIYNTLLLNPDQTEKGQHFTSNDEIDIINTFCIHTNTENVIDTACGAGAFLVRAYQRLKYSNPAFNHNELLEKIWGIEVDILPALLTKVNLFFLNLRDKDLITQIHQKDFSGNTRTSKIKLPPFDACIGNPPYIRQELIKNKDKWLDLVQNEYGLKNLNKQSDLYVYYLMHTVSFLKESGRLGYVIASSWLDVSYGKDLQKFLLDRFKIIAIIDQQNTRSFETASVNTVILIVEKCNNQKERENNNVKFVRITQDYSKIIGHFTDKNRFEKLNGFVQSIESVQKNIKNDNYCIKSINQKELELQSTVKGKYLNGHWGTKYLRVSEIYNQIINKAADKLVALREICDVKYGIKTGANDFFYLIDETEEAIKLNKRNTVYWETYGWYFSNLDKNHHILNRKYVKPILKSQREIIKLSIKVNDLKYCVLDIKNSYKRLKGSNPEISNYIKIGESYKYKINKRSTCAGRISKSGESDWFNLGKDIAIGDFIIPSKIGERFRLLDNRNAKVYCDKVNYNICIKPEFKQYSYILFAILNSTIFRYFIDLFARQLTGSQTLSDVDVNIVQDTVIPHPKYLLNKEAELKVIMESMSKRKQESIFKEIEFEDRKKLDLIIMNACGFGEKETEIIRKKAVEFVQVRKVKSDSLKTIKPVNKK
ncbi:class I SAM-dependent DNA methyltransferase [Bacteroidota bacterium]